MKLRKYIKEKKVINVWLDDERMAPSGWIHFKTVPELISFYEKNYYRIAEMSLDHDLGENTPTGYDFVLWLEEKIHFGKYNNIPNIKVHSANPVGRRRMNQALDSIKRKLKK